MGKKKDQSLTERLAALISRVGEKPEPTFGYLKGELVDCRTLAESLEEGAVIREAEAQVAALEAALEESNTENVNLKAELKAAKAEIESFLAEQKKREEKEREIDPTQFKILQRLASESEGNWLRIDEIARAMKIPVDEAEIYINGLKKLGLASFHRHEPSGGGWHRTAEGNTLVVAKRWAGEEEAEQRDPDRFGAPLSQGQQLLLLKVAKSNGVTPEELTEQLKEALPTLGRPIWTPQSVLFLLITLREKQMVIDQPAPSDKIHRKWTARRKGMEYLAGLGLV